MNQTLSHYVIVDTKTGEIVGKAKTLRSALNSVDRRDNAYGGYRFKARAVGVCRPARGC